MTTATANGNAQVPATLFEALACFQANLPKIAKGETAQVPTKQGGSYSYKYADLTDISEVAMPRLGALGLAFIARPTTRDDGKFGLAYSLVHVSGQREDGFYELSTHGMTPQQIGGLITYARRYCLCAATGIAPGGDDDDAAGAQQAAVRQSAADAFENAAPRQNGNGQPRGQVSRPAPAQATQQQPADVDEAAVADWAAKIDEIASTEDADRSDAELRDVFKSGRMNPTTANAIRKAIRTKREAVAQREMAGAQ